MNWEIVARDREQRERERETLNDITGKERTRSSLLTHKPLTLIILVDRKTWKECFKMYKGTEIQFCHSYHERSQVTY